MRPLITGGTGFISRNLAKVLPNPIILDRSINAKHDITQSINLDQDVSEVYHFAAISRVMDAIKDPENAIKTNVIGTLNMLEFTRKKDAKFIFASSREVYGEPENIPVSEDAPKKPKSIYGQTKLIGEKLCEKFQDDYGLEIRIVRFSNVYGLGDIRRVIPNFIERARTGKPITVNGDKILDFIYIEDVVSGILTVVKKGDQKPYNIGSGVGTSLDELAMIIKQITGSSSKIVKQQSITNEVNRFVADISRTKKLGWSPKVSLVDGLKKTIKYEEKKIRR